MPEMDTVVYDKLKEKLGEEKVTIEGKETKLVDLVADWEEGVRKTRVANKDLTGQRESWESKEKEYKKTINEFNSVKSDLEKKIEELAGGTKKKSAEAEELQRTLNAMNEQITDLTKRHEAAEMKAKEADERAKQANQKASNEELRKDIMTELAQHNIIGVQADFAVTNIFARGWAKLNPTDAGLYERSFCTYKDGKELKANTIKDLCKWFAETNTFLVSSNGKQGTGNDHNARNPVTKPGNSGNYYSMIAPNKKT